MNKNILDFIKRRFSQDCNWQNGNCYYFAIILKARFPEGKIVYDQIDGHFLFLLDNQLYDSTGQRKMRDYYIWDNLKDEDPLLYNSIIRDCIL